MTLAKGTGHASVPLGSRGPGASDGPVAPRPADGGNGGGGRVEGSDDHAGLRHCCKWLGSGGL